MFFFVFSTKVTPYAGSGGFFQRRALRVRNFAGGLGMLDNHNFNSNNNFDTRTTMASATYSFNTLSDYDLDIVLKQNLHGIYGTTTGKLFHLQPECSYSFFGAIESIEGRMMCETCLVAFFKVEMSSLSRYFSNSDSEGLVHLRHQCCGREFPQQIVFSTLPDRKVCEMCFFSMAHGPAEDIVLGECKTNDQQEGEKIFERMQEISFRLEIMKRQLKTLNNVYDDLDRQHKRLCPQPVASLQEDVFYGTASSDVFHRRQTCGRGINIRFLTPPELLGRRECLRCGPRGQDPQGSKEIQDPQGSKKVLDPAPAPEFTFTLGNSGSAPPLQVTLPADKLFGDFTLPDEEGIKRIQWRVHNLPCVEVTSAVKFHTQRSKEYVKMIMLLSTSQEDWETELRSRVENDSEISNIVCSLKGLDESVATQDMYAKCFLKKAMTCFDYPEGPTL